MFYSYRKIIVCVVMICVFCGIVFAKDGKREHFFSYGPGVVAGAMGEAFVAGGDDNTVIYYNPALLATLKSSELMISYWFMYNNAHYDYVAYAQKIGKAVLCAGGTQFTRDGIEARLTRTDDPKLFNNNQTAIYLGYAFPISIFNFGVSGKYYQHKIYKYDANSMGLDAGMQVYLLNAKRSYFDSAYQINEPDTRISLGFAVKNIVQPDITLNQDREVFPHIYTAGCSFYQTFSIEYDYIENITKYNFFKLEVDAVQDENVVIPCAGFELGFSNVFFVRGGYKKNITAGLGLALSDNLRFDYSYIITDLDMFHKFGLGCRI